MQSIARQLAVDGSTFILCSERFTDWRSMVQTQTSTGSTTHSHSINISSTTLSEVWNLVLVTVSVPTINRSDGGSKATMGKRGSVGPKMAGQERIQTNTMTIVVATGCNNAPSSSLLNVQLALVWMGMEGRYLSPAFQLLR